MKKYLHLVAVFYRILIIFIALQTFNHIKANEKFKEFLSQYKDIPVLVTGGCGFIGSHLAEKLIELGARVTILDNLCTGKLENVDTIIDQITFIHGDLTDLNTCLDATKDQMIIFHLGAFISVPASTENPHKCHEYNVTGTQNILEAARINTVKRFVFSSTCATYGEQTECNEHSKTSPTSPYGFSKLMGEMYCNEYADVFDLETVIMRYFNVFGPRQDPHGHYAGVIAKFSYNMEHNLPITIFGNGMQTRDYIPVEDVVKANLLLGIIDKKYIKNELFNIATGKSMNLFELIEMLKQTYPDYNAHILFEPARPGDVKHVSADCSKYTQLCKNLLGGNNE
jgi:nucleoside-diphosphate-sugar epimerase